MEYTLVNKVVRVFVFVELSIIGETSKYYITNCDMRYEGNKQEVY